ncbi:50S ribosomal protein L7ae [Clostridia bacterium]|nr:50S ribosomal protein L7ae [Clostridia bacterium]
MSKNNDALLSILGLCRRAGKMTLGNDVVIDSIINGSAKLVLMASDLSPRTEKGIVSVAEQYGKKVIKLNRTKEEMSIALGKYSAVVSVTDSGFAKIINKHIASDNNEEECNL